MPKKKKPGPKKHNFKYKREIRNDVITKVKLGLTDADIVKLFGFSQNLLSRWKQKDPKFAIAYHAAKIGLKENYLEALHKKSRSKNEAVALKAITWYLERNYPDEFSLRQNIQITDNKAPLDILLNSGVLEEDTSLVDEELREIMGEE